MCVSSLFNKDSADDTPLLLRKVNETSILIGGRERWIFHDLPSGSTEGKELVYKDEPCYSPSYPPSPYYDNDPTTAKLFFFYVKDKPILDLYSLEFGTSMKGSNPNILICTVYKSEIYYLKAKEGDRTTYLVQREPSSGYEEIEYMDESFTLDMSERSPKLAFIRLSTFGGTVLLLLEKNEMEFKCYLVELLREERQTLRTITTFGIEITGWYDIQYVTSIEVQEVVFICASILTSEDFYDVNCYFGKIDGSNILQTFVQQDIVFTHCQVEHSGRQTIFSHARLNSDSVVFGCKTEKGFWLNVTTIY
jgi:hypothetical protein